MPGLEMAEVLIAVVDFHHARRVLPLPYIVSHLTPYRGPEIELWVGPQEGEDPAAENDWSLLPFMALADGSHT